MTKSSEFETISINDEFKIHNILLNEIKKSNFKEINITKNLLRMITEVASNDFEYSFYFSQNKIANYFILDCFDSIISSYFVLEFQTTIKLFSSLLLYTNIEKETDENGNLVYVFQNEWLAEHYEYFFIKYQPFIQYSLIRYIQSKDKVMIESYFILINYFVVTLQLDKLIKSNFLHECVQFAVNQTVFCPDWSLKMVKFLLTKSDKAYKFCSCQPVTILDKTEQFILFESVFKCLTALVDFNGTRSDATLKKENLDGKMTRFYLNVFETIQEFGARIGFFYQLTGDLKIFQEAFQLFYKLTNFIHFEKAYRLIENSDAIYSYILIMKIFLKHDLSFVIDNCLQSVYRFNTVKILASILSRINHLSENDPTEIPYGLKVKNLKESERNFLRKKLYSIQNIIDTKLAVPLKPEFSSTVELRFRFFIDNQLLSVFEDIIYLLRNLSVFEYCSFFRTEIVRIVKELNLVVSRCR